MSTTQVTPTGDEVTAAADRWVAAATAAEPDPASRARLLAAVQRAAGVELFALVGELRAGGVTFASLAALLGMPTATLHAQYRRGLAGIGAERIDTLAGGRAAAA